MSTNGKYIGMFAVKTKLAEIFKRVENGERITITRRGAPIAEIIPAAKKYDPQSVREAIKSLRRFRSGRKLGDLSIREMIEDGRRY
jgi:prevent-host-death family protein